MRLLNTTTLQLHEFFGKIPGYAILSHTWEEEEVAFQDLTLRREAAKKMKGYLKIEGACRTAKAYDYEYVWVDTCCIDKSSSAELSEAVRPSSSVLIIVVD
jgi:hypothetical protein